MNKTRLEVKELSGKISFLVEENSMPFRENIFERWTSIIDDLGKGEATPYVDADDQREVATLFGKATPFQTKFSEQAYKKRVDIIQALQKAGEDAETENEDSDPRTTNSILTGLTVDPEHLSIIADLFYSAALQARLDTDREEIESMVLRFDALRQESDANPTALKGNNPKSPKRSGLKPKPSSRSNG